MVYTLELLEGSDPAVDVLIRDDLVASSAQFTDAEFLALVQEPPKSQQVF
ncbi:hypothetical protein ACKUV4_000065 [Acinetobacter baumannii]